MPAKEAGRASGFDRERELQDLIQVLQWPVTSLYVENGPERLACFLREVRHARLVDRFAKGILGLARPGGQRQASAASCVDE